MHLAVNGGCVRVATVNDLPAIRVIYNSAKAFMDAHNNPHQWPVGYPYDDILTEDIEAGRLFVICAPNSETPHGVFALIGGTDPTYVHIYDGAWLNDRDYVTLHRVGSDGVLSGIMKTAVAFAREEYPDCDIRIDTHEDNLKMQSVLCELGFERCGTIFIETGAKRTAYHRVVRPC